MVCAQTGADLKVVTINDAGDFEEDSFKQLLGPRTRLVAVTHLSNALGSIVPVERVIELAHARGVPVLLDGAQAIAHLVVDVQSLDCDFYAFSGHKIYGPTGIGVLYGKAALLDAMPPYQGGGDMIRTVTFEKTEYNELLVAELSKGGERYRVAGTIIGRSPRIVDMDRRTHVQRDRAGHVLAHLYMHQTHHRGQVHAMLAGTPIEPPQLDEFLMPSDAKFRTADMATLGWGEAAVYGPLPPGSTMP